MTTAAQLAHVLGNVRDNIEGLRSDLHGARRTPLLTSVFGSLEESQVPQIAEICDDLQRAVTCLMRADAQLDHSNAIIDRYRADLGLGGGGASEPGSTRSGIGDTTRPITSTTHMPGVSFEERWLDEEIAGFTRAQLLTALAFAEQLSGSLLAALCTAAGVAMLMLLGVPYDQARKRMGPVPPPALREAARELLAEASAYHAAKALARDARDTNPKYGDEPGYDVNCVHVVAAHELRRRGHDVTATPLPYHLRPDGGRDPRPPVSQWFKEDGQAAHLESADQQQALADIGKWPPGSRGWVGVYWLDGGGHIFNVEVLPTGEVRYLDAQDNQPDLNVSKYFDLAEDLVYFIRVDNLTPGPGVQDFYTQGAA